MTLTSHPKVRVGNDVLITAAGRSWAAEVENTAQHGRIIAARSRTKVGNVHVGDDVRITAAGKSWVATIETVIRQGGRVLITVSR